MFPSLNGLAVDQRRHIYTLPLSTANHALDAFKSFLCWLKAIRRTHKRAREFSRKHFPRSRCKTPDERLIFVLVFLKAPFILCIVHVCECARMKRARKQEGRRESHFPLRKISDFWWRTENKAFRITLVLNLRAAAQNLASAVRSIYAALVSVYRKNVNYPLIMGPRSEIMQLPFSRWE